METEIKTLINNLRGIGQMHGPIEAYKVEAAALFAKSFESAISTLEKSIDRNSETSNKLANKVFWLNLILTGATVIGAFVAAWSLFFPKAA